jgi:tape measure domain-containing protein
MANIATLTINLVAETARFTVALKKSSREANKFAGNVRRTLGTLAALGGTTFAIKGIVDAAIKMQQFERALKVATGSADGARREMQFVTDTANKLGLSLEITAQSYSKLAAASRGTALQGKAARDIFVGISEASRVLGLSAAQTGGALTAIEQIISKGKVSAEELRGQLGERLPGAFQLAARSIGVTTSELDVMLRKGELLAEDLLPSLAKELHDTFGPEVEAAANDAQAALNRFSTAVFQLKVAIAESGLLDAMARLAELGAATAQGLGTAFFNASPFPFEKEIADAQDRLDELRSKLQSFNQAGPSFFKTFSRENRKDIEAEIVETERLIKVLTGKQKIAIGLRPQRRDPFQAFGSFDKANAELDAFIAEVDKDTKEAAEKFFRHFETAEQEVARKFAELDLFAHLRDPEEIARIRNDIKSILTEGIEEIDLNQIRSMRRVAEKIKIEMSEFAKQAARNMHDAFADFFFNPFEDGLKGMLRSFVDVIRRMVANLLASNLLNFLGSLGGPFGNFFKLAGGGTGPNAALGGFRRNKPFIAGERGRELISPGAGSTVTPLGSTFMFETNINGGAGLDAATLIPILEQNNRKLKSEFVDELERRAYA